MSVTPLLELRGIDKSFGSARVLRDIAFSAFAGEVTALVGDNGAGKSTLVNCIGGLHPVDRGEFRFAGEPVRVSRPQDADDLGIGVVHQDLALCDNLDIVQNLFLGRELRRGAVLDEPTMEEQAVEVLSRISARGLLPARRSAAGLSRGQRQMIAIARAVLWKSRMVILDEPTAPLDTVHTQQVLEIARRLADQGLAVVFISHNMNDVFAVADRIAALYLGRMVAQVKASEITYAQLVELITSGQCRELGLPAAM